jgi:hypothetical protein
MLPPYLFVCLFAGSLKKSGLVLVINLVVFVGIQVSAFRKNRKASSSADKPVDTKVSGSQEPISPRSLFQRQVSFSPRKLSSSICSDLKSIHSII